MSYTNYQEVELGRYRVYLLYALNPDGTARLTMEFHRHDRNRSGQWDPVEESEYTDLPASREKLRALIRSQVEETMTADDRNWRPDIPAILAQGYPDWATDLILEKLQVLNDRILREEHPPILESVRFQSRHRLFIPLAQA